MVGCVYFVRGERGGPVKIGWSSGNPYARLSQLQCGSGDRLVLVGWMRADRADETAWHRQFKHLRLHGEWFRWVPELRRAIKPHTVAAKEKRRAEIRLEIEAEDVMLASLGDR